MANGIDADVLLRRMGGYATRERRRVLELLARSPQPVTAKKLHTTMGQNACDLATIHRTLNHLQKEGMVRSISFDGTSRWFDLVDQGRHHHHMFCTSCNQIEDIPLCRIDDFMDYAASRKGFQISSHVLELFGLCRSCRKKETHRRERVL
ncbi:MAG TPA: Fur family transcriptional regulator [Elusimicrobiota bacterium]|nr:Fur family transcriptional regulator [Elusimicrobiota bacterium]